MIKELLEWKDHPYRKPLIIKGSRQVGKSYLVNQFGQSFVNQVSINFERDPKAKALFQGSKEALDLLSKAGIVYRCCHK